MQSRSIIWSFKKEFQLKRTKNKKFTWDFVKEPFKVRQKRNEVPKNTSFVRWANTIDLNTKKLLNGICQKKKIKRYRCILENSHDFEAHC